MVVVVKTEVDVVAGLIPVFMVVAAVVVPGNFDVVVGNRVEQPLKNTMMTRVKTNTKCLYFIILPIKTIIVI